MTAETRGRVGYGFIARATLVVVAIWALAQGLWMIRDIAFLTFAAILLAVLFSLGVDRLEAVMPRWLGALIVLIVFLGVLFGVGILGWPALEGQVATLREEVPRMIGSAYEWVRQQYDALMPAAAQEQAREQAQQAAQQGSGDRGPGFGAQLAQMASGALPLLSTALGALTGVIVVIFAAVFLVVDPDVYLDGTVRLVPPDLRSRVRDALVAAGRALRRWLAGMAVSMVVIFATSTLGLYLLGVPAALVLGMIAALLVFIPFIGPVLSAIPAMAMAFTVSPTLALWVALLYFGIQLLESNFLTPMVMKEAVSLEPSATILFQMAMGVLFGFLGLFFAVPLFAALRVLVQRLYIEPMEA